MMFYNMFLGKINKFMYMHTHNRTCAEDDDVMSAPMSRFFFLGKINKFMYMHTHNRTCAEDDDVMSAPMSRFLNGRTCLCLCVCV